MWFARKLTAKCPKPLVLKSPLHTGRIKLLLDNRAQLTLLDDDPQLWPNAVDEVLRLDPPVLLTGRSAIRDTVVAGQLLVLSTWRSHPEPTGALADVAAYYAEVAAYLNLAANPYPSFGGDAGYPVDIEIEVARRQSRGRVAARLVLAIPAIVLSGSMASALSAHSIASRALPSCT